MLYQQNLLRIDRTNDNVIISYTNDEYVSGFRNISSSNNSTILVRGRTYHIRCKKTFCKRIGRTNELKSENDFHYFQQFDLPTTIQKQAVLAYSGTIYQKLDASTFKEKDFLYAQQHLRIISTLYGILRPLDAIKAYRLMFSLKVPDLGTKDLYQF